MKVPPYEITDKKVSLEDIFGGKIKQLYEQILNCSSFKEAVPIIENHLIHAIYNSTPYDAIVADASVNIIRTNGSISMNKLYSAYDISERRLEQRFIESLGVSPKFFCRLVRFQNALKLLNSGINLTEITYKCGYFDQSHFIRDFKLFSEVTPNKYLAEKHSIDDIYSTAPTMA